MGAIEAPLLPAQDSESQLLCALTADDAEAAVALSDEAGWNQTVEDWRFMLGYGRGLGSRGPDGRLQGSALIMPLGPRLSWISMVLVTGRRRREGLGTRLLARCIDEVIAAGGVPGLDATELGRPVYLPLGFRDLYPISRWRLAATTDPVPAPAGCRIRRIAPDDLDTVAAFDAARTGAARGAVVRYLMSRVPDHAHLAEADGRLIGYALGRPGRRAAQVGPVVADSEDVARALMSRMTVIGEPVILDTPDVHRRVSQWLQGCGAARERGFMRMTLGRHPGVEEPSRIYALAGPELS